MKAVIIALIISAVISLIYFNRQYSQDKMAILADLKGYDKKQLQTINEIGKLFYLPQDELPTTSFIDNLQGFADHPYLSRAKLGDQVLLYSGANLAIIYRPSINKIVASGPLQQK